MESEVLDVRLHLLESTQALEGALALLQGEGSHYIVTINPEFLVASRLHHPFRKALNGADISLIDGVGIFWALEYVKRIPRWLYHTNHRRLQWLMATSFWITSFSRFTIRALFRPSLYVGRVAGSDLIKEIFSRVAPNHSVYMIGGLPSTQEPLRSALAAQYPHMNVCGVEYGLRNIRITDQGIAYDKEEDAALCHRIQRAAPTVLIVGFGQIKQELWISEHLLKFPSVRLFIGVGGALDFISGAAMRCPYWMRYHGLEWLWRLITEPRRFGRIFTATVRFPLLVLRHQWRQLSLYHTRGTERF